MATMLLLSALAVAPPARRVAPPAPVNPFLPTAASSLAVQADANFRAWPALNDAATRMAINAGKRYRLHLPPADDDPTRELFAGDSLMCRFSVALAKRKALDRKEFFESCEFFSRVRSKLKADDEIGGTLVDVAGGHGLVAALCAIFKYKDFGRTIVRDRRRPKAFDAIVSAAEEVAPWVAGRITYEQGDVGPGGQPLPEGCAVVSVHGCGKLTDMVIAAAAAANARSIALMPCCYAQTAADAPEGLRSALGAALAADVHRTYTLDGLGYSVVWRAIPQTITPMNRILLAHRPKATL
jgi:hypothetical protein